MLKKVSLPNHKNGKFKAVIRGDNGKDNSANVSNIKRNVINYNDARPWFNCNSCTAELDGYNDVDYQSIDGGNDE